MANPKTYLSTASLVLLCAFALDGCTKALTPQEICVAPDTVSNVQDLLDGQSSTGISADVVKPDALTAALQGLWKSGGLKLDLITLKSVDHDTSKISCEGQVEIKLADNQQKVMAKLANPDAPDAVLGSQVVLSALGIDKTGDAFHNGQASIAIQFQRQPSADGKSFVFAYERSDQLEAAVRIAGALQALSTATAATTSQPVGTAADQPNSSQPSSDGAIGSFVIQASDTDAPDGSIVKTAPGQLTGKIEFNHDAAGGSYALNVGGTSHNLGYVSSMADDVQDKLSSLQNAGMTVTVTGQIDTWKDGTQTFSNRSPIQIAPQP